MIGLLVLHIVALLFWVGSLFYLPSLVASHQGSSHSLEEPPAPIDSLSKMLFISFATPAALVAIIAGTLVFLVDISFRPWLIAKLTVVCLLVVAHTLVGVLIVQTESRPDRNLKPWCVALLSAVSLLVALILWLVLAKPPLEQWL